MKHIKEFTLNEEKDYYPEFKEMNYSNISSVKEDLKELNKFFKMMHGLLDRDGFGNESADMWRKIERSIKLLDHELNLKK